jgi:hypothetical protein
MRGAIPPHSQYIFMASCSVKVQEQLYLLLLLDVHTCILLDTDKGCVLFYDRPVPPARTTPHNKHWLQPKSGLVSRRAPTSRRTDWHRQLQSDSWLSRTVSQLGCGNTVHWIPTVCGAADIHQGYVWLHKDARQTNQVSTYIYMSEYWVPVTRILALFTGFYDADICFHKCNRFEKFTPSINGDSILMWKWHWKHYFGQLLV